MSDGPDSQPDSDGYADESPASSGSVGASAAESSPFGALGDWLNSQIPDSGLLGMGRGQGIPNSVTDGSMTVPISATLAEQARFLGGNVAQNVPAAAGAAAVSASESLGEEIAREIRDALQGVFPTRGALVVGGVLLVAGVALAAVLPELLVTRALLKKNPKRRRVKR